MAKKETTYLQKGPAVVSVKLLFLQKLCNILCNNYVYPDIELVLWSRILPYQNHKICGIGLMCGQRQQVVRK